MQWKEPRGALALRGFSPYERFPRPGSLCPPCLRHRFFGGPDLVQMTMTPQPAVEPPNSPGTSEGPV